jgi:hypothetical protein
MKKVGVLTGIFSILLVFALVIASCENLANDDDIAAGTWTGTVSGYSATIVAGSGVWTFSVPLASIYEVGTYILSGSTATLTSGGDIVGTATVSGNTMILILNSNSDYEGTYSLTKQ